jgi:hypothetical protein
MLGRTSTDQTEYLSAGSTFGKKKKPKEETLNPQPIKNFSTPHYTEKTGGLQHHQMQTNRTGC